MHPLTDDGDTEAKFVKDIDKLEMIYQAREYEQGQCERMYVPAMCGVVDRSTIVLISQ